VASPNVRMSQDVTHKSTRPGHTATSQRVCVDTDDETGQAFRQTAAAFGETAQAFQNTTEASRTRRRPSRDHRPGGRGVHRADLAVDPHTKRFVTDAIRDGRRVLFYWPTDGTVDIELDRVEEPPVPGDAQLITWQSDAVGPPPVPHVCGAPR